MGEGACGDGAESGGEGGGRGSGGFGSYVQSSFCRMGASAHGGEGRRGSVSVGDAGAVGTDEGGESVGGVSGIGCGGVVATMSATTGDASTQISQKRRKCLHPQFSATGVATGTGSTHCTVLQLGDTSRMIRSGVLPTSTLTSPLEQRAGATLSSLEISYIREVCEEAHH